MARAAAHAARAAAPATRSAAPARTAPGYPVPARPVRRVRPGHPRPAPRAARLRAPAGLLDRLLRGPALVVCVGALLAGIVFFNVSALQVGGEISHASQRASALKRENADLRLRVAKLASTERIQKAAAAQGFGFPKADEVTYLESSVEADSHAAASALDDRPESAVPTLPPGVPEAGSAEPGAAQTAAPAPSDPAG